MKRAKVSTSKPIHGEKTIEVTLRFWTNNIARGRGKIIPKNAWSSGSVYIVKNDSHGIRPKAHEYFHSMFGLDAAIEKTLIKHRIVLHQTGKMTKYMARGRK